ncbi:hypothetical protein DOH12_22880 [Salmonella enterica subsp. enterica]|nr:hypothetical protein [Salmonella enterica subsp. enterica serovar Sandiego]
MNLRSIAGDRKIPTGTDVLTAARQRIADTFELFDHICLSFSGGNDSTVMLHLTAEEVCKRNRKFSILFIDWEVQYRAIIAHVAAMRERYSGCTEQFYHVCLPLTTVNGVSAIQPEWTTFESFVPAFNQWFTQEKNVATLVGIRADESLNRFLAISSLRKLRLSPDRPWPFLLKDD